MGDLSFVSITIVCYPTQKLCRTYLLCDYKAPSLRQGLFGGAQRADRRWTPTVKCLRPQTARSTQPDLRRADARRGKKGELPPPLSELHRLLRRGLQKTEPMWPAIEKVYSFVHQAAHLLANHEEENGQAMREHYQTLLRTMREQQASLGSLSEAISTFLKVTESYWLGLFQCYDVADLPRTDNELEQCFGSVRYGERRASGRRGAIAGLVVRWPVRVVTALALRRQCFLPRALSLQDPEAWYAMREQLDSRREARRKQLRFRKDPAAYLAALEEILLKTSLPS